MRRALWSVLSPFVWIANRVGVCSYKWVNVCHGARRRDRFDALWHYTRYGTPITSLPDSVVLCGLEYRTAVAEGTVTFVCESPRCRITFERDQYDRFADLWYILIAGPSAMPASHVEAAYAWVRAVFGCSFEHRRAVT